MQSIRVVAYDVLIMCGPTPFLYNIIPLDISKDVGIETLLYQI